MPLEVWVWSLSVPLVLVLANRQSTPKSGPNPSSKLFLGDVVAFGVGVALLSLLLGLTGRWISSVAIAYFLIVLLWAGNRLKVQILEEALVFSDIFLAGHAIKYPRLYFFYAPFWIWPLLLCLSIALLGGIWLEPVFLDSLKVRLCWVLMPIALFALGATVARCPSRKIKTFLGHYPLTFLTQSDVALYSPLGAALLHCFWHGQYRQSIREKSKIALKRSGEEVLLNKAHSPRHLVLIQAESFCRLDQLLHRSCVTPSIDVLMKTGQSGQLLLDWRGAYTMRSEFAVLTGKAPRSLQTYGFDPYQLASQVPLDSLARDLKSRGYHTVAWHPNDGRFFDRNHVFPHLGFDAFKDIEAFDNVKKLGRYVSDEGLLEKAVAYLRQCEEPTFLFIVTMEAHGPWLEDRFEGAEHLSETERYETHLKSLDRGVSLLKKAIEEGLACDVALYGDHLPGLKILQNEKDHVPANTPWFIWGLSIKEGLQTIRPELLREQLLKRVDE